MQRKIDFVFNSCHILPMKLHLPVRLFRAVVALCSLAVGIASSCYVSSAVVPDGYKEVIIVMEEELTDLDHTEGNRAFLVKSDLLFDGLTSPLMGEEAESWYLSGSSNISMSFTNATDRVFDVAATKRLEFETFDEILFEANENEVAAGVAIYLGSSSTLKLTGNKNVLFSGSHASCNYGGSICGVSSSSVMLNDNGSVKFFANSSWYGGAIYGDTISLNDNDLVEFSENLVSTWNYAKGGAVCCNTITLNGNDRVNFSSNSATSGIDDSYPVYGGAIYGSEVTLSNNRYVEFHNNRAFCNFSGIRFLCYGGAIYGSTVTLSGNESVTFSGNTSSDDGGAIYGSTIMLSDNTSVTFSGNSAGFRGGAIYGSMITLNGNENVTFSENSGGAIYGGTVTLSDNVNVEFSGNSGTAIYGDTITLSGNGSVKFSGDSISGNGTVTLSDNVNVEFSGNYGTAIYGASGSTITLSDNGNVEFCGNYDTAIGGGDYITITLSRNASVMFGESSSSTIYGKYGSTITLSRNGSVTFCGNTASGNDGAIRGGSYSMITLSDNGNVEFRGYTASSSGGAISVANFSTLTLIGNESVEFSGNMASDGGAIRESACSTITLSGNGSVTFCENKASFDGGAIRGDNESAITLSGNGSVEFSGNTASIGGAIYGYDSSTMTLSGNESVTFIGNSAFGSSYAWGGAIYGRSGSTITLSGNGSVTFSGNTASFDGGAIYGDGTISLSDNESVEFSGNMASDGGAIYGGVNSTITLNGNEGVTFSGNTASSSGGAIYGRTITLSSNGSVKFSGNKASDGSAIYAYGNLSIRNNDSVLFEKNGNTYRLRSIYAGGSGDVISLSAAEGGNIEFRDSVYIASSYTVELNADYSDADGVVHKQTGDIIFTGAYTEQHLNELLADAEAGRTATADEILNSRTTVLYAMTNLYGGRLCVEDGAVYKGYGITTYEDSIATIRVKDAVLDHAGYDITLGSGSTLELEGGNTISASQLVMQEGSNLHFVLCEEDTPVTALTLNGALQLNGVVNLSFDATPGVYKLISLSGSELCDWSLLTVAEECGYDFSLSSDNTGLTLEVFWTPFAYAESGTEMLLSGARFGQVQIDKEFRYESLSATDGCYSLVGCGNLNVEGIISVSGGADVVLNLNTAAVGVEVGDDSRLDIRKGLNLVSLMSAADEESGTDGTKAISVGRNAELSLTDGTLLGQVALADETSGLYYQTESGMKLLQFSGDLGAVGLNLTTGEDGRTVSVANIAGFTGDIAVLSDAVLELQGENHITGTLEMRSGSALQFLLGEENQGASVISLEGNFVAESGVTYALKEYELGTEYQLISMSGTQSDREPESLRFVGNDGSALNAALFRWKSGTLYFATEYRIDTETNFHGFDAFPITGSGVYRVSGVSDIKAANRISLSDSWAGTIVLEDCTSSGMELDYYANETSRLVIDGVSGWFGGASSRNMYVNTLLELAEDGLNVTDSSRWTYHFNGGISGTGDFVVATKSTHAPTYAFRGDLSGWDGAFRVQQSSANSNTPTVGMELTDGGVLFSGAVGSGVYLERLGTLNVSIGNADAATTMQGAIINAGVEREGIREYGELNLTVNHATTFNGTVDVTKLTLAAGAAAEFNASLTAGSVAMNANSVLTLTGVQETEPTIGVLSGSGVLTVTGGSEKQEVRIASISSYAGAFSVSGANSTLALNLAADDVLDASRVTLESDAALVLGGCGTYDLGTAKSLASGVSLGDGWSGTVRLNGAVMSGDSLAGLSNPDSFVELRGVSGYLNRADSEAGVTYTQNLVLSDVGEAAALSITDGYQKDKRIFAGSVSGSGTFARATSKCGTLTYIFAGDVSGWDGAFSHAPEKDNGTAGLACTLVTFNGSREINAAVKTNGKGVLNVALDDENLVAGEKVTVNSTITADRLEVTEGTTVSLKNTASVDTLRAAGVVELASGARIEHGEMALVSREEADMALFFDIESTEESILGLSEESALRHVSISGGAEYLMQNLELENVSYTAEQSALTLRQVEFTGNCMFSVGATGTILLDEATLLLSVGSLEESADGVLELDYSDLFHCTASGELEITMDKDVDSLLSAGYNSITLNLGDDVNYDNLNLTLKGATYTGNSQGVAQFALLAVPEPTSATLSMLALAALAARRRRK